MDSSKQRSNELTEVQKAISTKAGNVIFLKKVNIEKGGPKYLAISTNRVFLLSLKAPYKIESSFHFLEIKSIESTKSAVLQLRTANEKAMTYVIITDDDEDILFIVAQTLALLQYNFPGSQRCRHVKLNIEPAERLNNIKNLAAALASPATDTETRPCGGFSLSYSSICDLHGVAPMAEVIWDVDKIYGSHDCKDFNISDFDHLEVKELLPMIGTFEFNNWFKGFSCRSYRLSSELVDVLSRVLKSNKTIEELDLYECRLTKESVQKLLQAIASNPKTGLKRINLGKNSVDDRGVSSLCNFLSNLPHGLESLLLKDVGITGKGASSICSALKTNIHMSSSLTVLNISSNPLKADGASAVCEFLANANVIQELNLSKSECSLELVFGALARGCLQNLKVLNLSGNPLSYRKGKDSQIGPSINKFFSSSMALESVNLSNTKISPEFVKAILIGLISNAVLKNVSLMLASNELRSAGASEIASCIRGLGNVTHLDLRDNALDMDIVTLCHSIHKNKSLQSLDLSQNIGKSKNINISAILESIVEMILSDSLPLRKLCVADNRLRQDAGIIIDSLGTNNKLEELDISGNFIGDDGARLLAKALQINTKLREINLDRNGISLKGFQSLATSMQRNYSLQLIPVPFADIYPLMKNNGDTVTKCFEKIDKLLLRNQSMEITGADHSLKLKQNLLLNSLDQESTDLLLVQVQDAVAQLKDVDGDEIVRNEVERGRESIKDADKMKQILFKLFVDTDDPSKKIEERANSLLKEMTDFADELVKVNVDGSLDYLRKQCPTIAKNNNAMEELKKLISVKGKVDSLGLKETVAHTLVKLISYKVSDATLNMASTFGEHLTKIMQETLIQSKGNLSLLAMEKQSMQRDGNAVKIPASLPTTPTDEKDESLLAAQKAKNRMSAQLLTEDVKGASKGKGVTRRPTFRRETQFEEVAVEISIDDIPATENASSSKDEAKKLVKDAHKPNGSRSSERKQSVEEKKAKKEMEEKRVDELDDKLETEKTSSRRSKPNGEEMDAEGAKSEQARISEQYEAADDAGQAESNRLNEISSETVGESDVPAKGKKSEEKKSLQKIADSKRAASVSLKQLEKGKVRSDKKLRPQTEVSFKEIDVPTPKELVHLNKGRAKPKGRRPPSKVSGLAHLAASEAVEIKIEPPKSEEKDATAPAAGESISLQTPSPKPRPKSMQPLDSSILDKERGVIRTGSIPHKSSESLKARLKAEGEKSDLDLPPKPEMKKSPKPEVQQKDEPLKKPKLPMGVPLHKLPNVLGKPSVLQKKNRSSSVKKSTESAENGEGKKGMPADALPSDEGSKEALIERSSAEKDDEEKEDEKEKEEEVVEKPTSKKFKPPGGVPMMGFGGALMAEMKKKRGIKEKEPDTPTSNPTSRMPAEEKPGLTSPPSVAARPSQAAKKPPPPAKLSAEKRRSLILDAGSRPVITDKPDGPSSEVIREIGSVKGGEDIKEEKSQASNEEENEAVKRDSDGKEQNNNSEISGNTA